MHKKFGAVFPDLIPDFFLVLARLFGLLSRFKRGDFSPIRSSGLQVVIQTRAAIPASDL